tara:strand:+ start:180 stop:350 length:171 start_codon:yes stop_codon:yes gene_type:complete
MNIEYIAAAAVAIITIAAGLYKVIKKRLADGLSLKDIIDTVEDVTEAVEEVKEAVE